MSSLLLVFMSQPSICRWKVKTKLSKGIKISRIGVRTQDSPAAGSLSSSLLLNIERQRTPRAKLGESAARWQAKREEYLKSEFLFHFIDDYAVTKNPVGLSAPTRRALQHVSEDIGRLDNLDCDNAMDAEDWEDIVNGIHGVGPNDDLEISHEGGEYLAVYDYNRILGDR